MPKSKFQKRKEREHQIRHQHNVALNHRKPEFALQVNLPEKGWTFVKQFGNHAMLDKYLAEIEGIRAKGDTEIIAGRVYRIKNRTVVAEIPPFKPGIPGQLPGLKSEQGVLPESAGQPVELAGTLG